MGFSQRLAVAVAMAVAIPAAAETAAQPPNPSANELAAESHLRAEAGIVRCGPDEFLFGVAYIDGSYLERLFLVRDEQGGPRLEVSFRAPQLWPAGSGPGGSQDLAPMPFSLELWAPRSRYALPSGSHWRVPAQEWETALRFKYTNWYGEISRHGGVWKVAWHGFRRPMLPAAGREDWAEVCRLLAAP